MVYIGSIKQLLLFPRIHYGMCDIDVNGDHTLSIHWIRDERQFDQDIDGF